MSRARGSVRSPSAAHAAMAMAEVRSAARRRADVDARPVRAMFDEEIALLAEVPNIAEAAADAQHIVADGLIEFLTLPAYALLD